MPNIETAGAVVTSRANVNDNASGTFTLISGVASKYVRLHRLVLSCATADNITLKFGATTILGPVYMGANSVLIIDFHPLRLVTGANENVTLTKGTAGTAVTAFAQYTQEY